MKIIFKHLKPYWFLVVIALSFVFIQTLTDLYLPTLMSDIINKGLLTTNLNYIYQVGGKMLLVAILGMICSIGSVYLASLIASKFSYRLRRDVFNHVQSFSLVEMDKLSTSSLITRTTNDVTQLQMVTVMILRMMVMAPLMAIGGIIMAYSKDHNLTIIFAVSIPILILVISVIARRIIPLFNLLQQKIDQINQIMREKLTGLRVIRAFNNDHFEHKRYTKANKGLMDTSLKVMYTMAMLMPIMLFIINLVSIAVIWFGGHRIDSGSMQIGDLMAFIQYAMQIMFSFISLSMMFIMIPRAIVSSKRISEVLSTKPTIRDPKSEQAMTGNDVILEFDHVSFKYPHSIDNTLTDITFKLKRGETLAILGATGSAKTTLLNLIMRFYDVTDGEIFIQGVNIKNINQHVLRAIVALVSQKAILFEGTILDNLKMGHEEATDLEIDSVCKTAMCDEFINSLDHKYMTHLAQGATNLSGGQKQRLSIARSLLRSADLYLFDDSFSALDYETDHKVRKNLKTCYPDMTKIIVAQRIGTVMDADKIMILDEGHMMAFGSHQSLIKTSNIYKEIVESQLSKGEVSDYES